jgi:U3 small nucleolar RNA-associated protein 15
LVRTYSKFKDKVYTSSYRSDGNLVVAGGEHPIVHIFDPVRKTTLRTFKGHKGPVHSAMFSPGNLHVLTTSDDKSVKLWDLTSNNPLMTFAGHKDYVRSCAASNDSSDIWFTGSYDHSIRGWDVRSSEVRIRK